MSFWDNATLDAPGFRILVSKNNLFYARVMATAYSRDIMNEASDSLVNMQSPAYCLRLKLRVCDFIVFIPSVDYVWGGSSASLGSSMASERQVTTCVVAV